MKINAGILAIGDEVVHGQITNRNASWLASELLKVNITTTHHLACRDHHQDIIESLNFLHRHCQLIIVSGGLGPTKDDDTRESLSQWLDKELVFNENQWNKIQDKLNARKVPLREGHKKQAFAPLGATMMDNEKGVAPGFYAKKGDCFVASLPGPPGELSPMYTHFLLPIINEKIKAENQQKLYTWICLGAPESEIAHIAESLLEQQESFNLGFRLHKPYVEIKVWAPKELSSLEQKLFTTLESKIKPWFVSYSIENIRQNFHNNLKQYDGVYVIDHLTSGLLLEKLKEDYRSEHIRYQCFEHKAYRHFSKEEVKQIYQHMKGTDKQLFICLFPHTENSALLFFNDQYKLIEIPRGFPLRSKIGQLYAIENIFLMGNSILPVGE